MRWGLVAAAGGSAAFAAACSLFFDPGAESEGAAPPLPDASGDGGSQGAGTDAGGQVEDAGIDACSPDIVVVDETFTPEPNPAWLALGTTTLNTPDPGWAQLTGLASYAVGALMWNTPIDFDAFEIDATIAIEKPDGGGDGMAFVWGKKLGPGATGNSKGYVSAIEGYGVEFDTYRNVGEDPDAAVPPFLAVGPDTLPRVRFAHANLPAAVVDGMPHTLHVRLKDGRVAVDVDDTAVLRDVVLPGYEPFRLGLHRRDGAGLQPASRAKDHHAGPQSACPDPWRLPHRWAPDRAADCVACGRCCHHPPRTVHFLEPDDARMGKRLLALYTDLEMKPPGFRFMKNRKTEAGEDRCAGLDLSVPGSYPCGVYDVRPEDCRIVEPGSPACLEARRLGHLGSSVEFKAPLGPEGVAPGELAAR